MMGESIGLLATLTEDGKVVRCAERAGTGSWSVGQLVSWDLELATPEVAKRTGEEAHLSGVRVCALWAGFPGRMAWDFKEGPITLGIEQEDTRAERIEALKKWADFAVWIGAPAIITHCGFIPENMTDPAYPGVVAAIREVAEYCEERGIGFWFETGQETPVVSFGRLNG